MESVIKVENLTKDFGGRGVFDISFEIPSCEVFGFLGPNGAGKTTTIPLIINSGIKLLVSLVKALPEIIITIVEAIPLIVNSIVDYGMEVIRGRRRSDTRIVAGETHPSSKILKC